MVLKDIMTMVKGVLLTLAPQLKKADAQHGVKELNEAIAGGLTLGYVLAARFKDGVGVDDLAALWDTWKNDAEVQKALKDAVDGYDKIPAEAGELDWGDGLELAANVVDYVPKYVDALKKEEPVAPPVA